MAVFTYLHIQDSPNLETEVEIFSNGIEVCYQGVWESGGIVNISVLLLKYQ